MAVTFLVAIDEFLLDRVFQPIADRLHQWCGATPEGIAEFLCIGNVLFTIAQNILRNPIISDFGSASHILMVVMDVFLAIILSLLIVYPRANERNGMNYKRATLFFLRAFWLFGTLFSFVTVPGMIYRAESTFHLLAICASEGSQICLWTAANFASLHKPPPRKQRESKFLAWLRPRYAT